MWEEKWRWHKGKQDPRSLSRFICGLTITGALSPRLARSRPRSRKRQKSPGEAVNISMALLPHPCYLLLLVHLIKHPQANPWQGQLLKPKLHKTSQVWSRAKSNSLTTAANLGCSDWRVSLWNQESGRVICTPEESEVLRGTRRWIPTSLAPAGLCLGRSCIHTARPHHNTELRCRCTDRTS